METFSAWSGVTRQHDAQHQDLSGLLRTYQSAYVNDVPGLTKTYETPILRLIEPSWSSSRPYRHAYHVPSDAHSP